MLFKKNEFPTILIVSSLKRRRGLPKVSKCTVSSADCCRDVVMQEYGGPAGKRAFSGEGGASLTHPVEELVSNSFWEESHMDYCNCL